MSHRPISASDLERKLRSLSGVLGANPLPELDDLKGLITLENDRPEWYLAGQDQLSGVINNSAAVAGNLSYNALVNPLGSGLIAIVTFMSFSFAAASATLKLVNSGVPAAAPFLTGEAGSNQGFSRDLRGLLAGVRGSFGSNLVSPFGNGIQQIFNQQQIEPKDSIAILPPGSAIVVEHGVANTAINGWFWWRERPLEGKFDVR